MAQMEQRQTEPQGQLKPVTTMTERLVAKTGLLSA
jgi:hypothetical protein